MVAVFFVGLSRRWRTAATRRQWRLVGWTQLFGASAGLAFVLTAVYPIDDFDAHQFWSRMMFGSFAASLFVSAMAFRRRGTPNCVLSVVGVIGWLVITVAVVLDWYWLEWVAVAMLLVWLLLIAGGTARRRPVRGAV